MIDNLTLGRRLKFFRERAHISQFDLEGQMNAASGMISRIESGKVNPSKESVLAIANILKLNNKEIDYLIGNIAFPPTQEEIDKAINQIKDYFAHKNTFAYLLDERWRAHYASEGIYRLLQGTITNPKETIEKQFGKTILSILLNKELGLSKLLFQEDYYNNTFLNFQFARYFDEVGFMTDDESYRETLNLIEQDPALNKIWHQVQTININTNILDSKVTKIKVFGMNISLNYSREMLPKNPRFETIELFPTNKFIKLLMKV